MTDNALHEFDSNSKMIITRLENITSKQDEQIRHIANMSDIDSKIRSLLTHVSIMSALCVFLVQETKLNYMRYIFLAEMACYALVALFCLFLLNLNLNPMFSSNLERLKYNYRPPNTLDDVKLNNKLIRKAMAEVEKSSFNAGKTIDQLLKKMWHYVNILYVTITLTLLLFMSILFELMHL